MNKNTIADLLPVRLVMRSRSPQVASLAVDESRPAADAGRNALPGAFPFEALDDRIAIVGTAGSGKTYAAKGFIERLLHSGMRVAIVDPLGVWWGLRASADGTAAGYPVVVFGGRHADVPIIAEMGAALGRLIASEALACVIDLSELGSNAARRRFMAAFAERCTRRTRNRCTWSSTRRICGRRSGRSKAGKASSVTSRRLSAAAACAVLSHGSSRNARRSCTRTCCRRPTS
jgi:hypothetical protein